MGAAMRCLAQLARDCRGQATVEAAVALPVVFTLLLMLVQPSIILYDRLVMQQAAAEGCRVLMTSQGGDDERVCEDYVRRRLSAVPEQACFHVHEDECTWDIELAGSSASSQVSVSISTEVRPLPLLDAAAALAGLVNDEGNLVVNVKVSMDAQPTWFANAGLGSGAASWVGAWLHD